MAGARQQQYAKTRADILDAAIRVFAQAGYDGGNFREITAICGAQRSLILYHFQTKDALWKLAAEEVERRFTAVFDRGFATGAGMDDREKVRHGLSCFIDALCEVPEYGQIYLREGVTSGPRMEWLAHNFVPRSTLSVKYDDPTIGERLRSTILRDIVASTLVTFVTLRPLLDRSRAVVTQQTVTGGKALSSEMREELIDHLVKLIF